MAKEFDIYLRRQLTECDLLIYSIPYHDGLSVTNRVILEAALHGYFLQKFAAAQMDSELTAHIDKMIKLCLEKLSIGIGVDATAELEAHSTIYLDNSPIIVSTPAVETLEWMLTEVENNIILAVEPLITQLALSAGKGQFPLTANASVSGTLKQSLLNLRSALMPEAEVGQINQVDYISGEMPAAMDSTLSSLCYQLTFEASAAVEIVALVLGTDIHHSLGTWYNGMSIGSKVAGTWAQKFETAQTVAAIMQEATGKLIKVLYPDDSVVTLSVPSLDAGLKRYRLLRDVDDLTLADIDDMTLEDMDYVIL